MFVFLLRALSLVFIGLIATSSATAQTFPARPIRVLVGFSAGVGVTDSLARLYADRMSKLLGVPVIVENRAGANQLAAIRAVQQGAADGYTLWLATGSALATSPAIRSDLPYDPLKDFTLLGMVATTSAILVVNPELPVKSVRELVAYAAANPGKLNFGSSGFGTGNHLQMELLMNRTGMKLTHVPFKNDADMVREVVSGNLHAAIVTVYSARPLVEAGRLRALSVTSPGRQPLVPDVPGAAESDVPGMKDMHPFSFFGLVGPAGMPAEIVDRLGHTVAEISRMPDVISFVRDSLASEPVAGSPAEFRSFIADELAKWKALGIRLEAN